MRRDELLEKVLAGGYPPVAARPTGARRKAWFQSYLTTILQRDVRDLANIADLTRRAATAGGGGQSRRRVVEFCGLVAQPRVAPDHLETLLRLAGGDVSGATAAALVGQPGPAGHPDPEGLSERHRAAGAFVGTDDGTTDRGWRIGGRGLGELCADGTAQTVRLGARPSRRSSFGAQLPGRKWTSCWKTAPAAWWAWK